MQLNFERVYSPATFWVRHPGYGGRRAPGISGGRAAYLEYLSDMTVSLAPGIALLPGYLDRAARHGLLSAIRAVIAARQRARLYRRTYAGGVAFGSSSLIARRTRSASRSASRILLWGDPWSKKITVSQ